MRIAVASDHAGYAYKRMIAMYLTERGHEVVDFGCHGADDCDYPDFIGPAAAALGRGEVERAVMLGGSGNGEAIVANRVRGVRCAVCHDAATARWARAHNDANCISIGERVVDRELCLAIIDLWLQTPFDGGRHQRRIAKIDPA
jgi:ribose 5-phosphate isomerase B